MRACMVRLSPLEAIQQRARVTASTSIVRLEVETAKAVSSLSGPLWYGTHRLSTHMRSSSRCSTLVLVVVVVATSTTTIVICFVFRRKADCCVLCVQEKGLLLCALCPGESLTVVCFVCPGERLAVVCFVSTRKADCCVLCVQEKG